MSKTEGKVRGECRDTPLAPYHNLHYSLSEFFRALVLKKPPVVPRFNVVDIIAKKDIKNNLIYLQSTEHIEARIYI